MADEKFENCCFFIEISISRFLGVLNPNLKTELQDLKWRIQYSRLNNILKFDFQFLIRYIEFSNSVIRFRFSDP